MGMKEVAEEVIADVESEDMSLAEHDLRYHDNNYRGGPCLYRERLGKGDNSDDALNEANEEEGKLWAARRRDKELITESLQENFPFITLRNKAFVQLSEPDEKGNNRLIVWCSDKIPDEAMSREKLEPVMKKMGYDTKDFSIMIEKGQGRANDKKAFVADVRRSRGFQFAKKDTDEQRIGAVKHVGSENLDDNKKSELLKQYGMKSEGGAFKRRTQEDAQKDRIRKYLGITVDFEGQSNREDRKTKKWEEEKKAAGKRSMEARQAFLREIGVI